MDRIFFGACVLAALVTCETANATTKQHKRPHAEVDESLSASSALRNACADPFAVCWAGTYIGRDPDPHVRAQMLWDFQAGSANN
jgi:hypothetical protein